MSVRTIQERLNEYHFRSSLEEEQALREITQEILREQGAVNSTITRELTAIKRAFTLGNQKRLISNRSHVNMLKEDNVRQGFFEPERFQDLLKHLPVRVKLIVRFV